ncbi:hypothetical protein NMY22_g11611 [Coprinellus aureogranulatus]|nr:hypothetical protein NMY22_g11611 [Coprinellus aureogranulatus]
MSEQEGNKCTIIAFHGRCRPSTGVVTLAPVRYPSLVTSTASPHTSLHQAFKGDFNQGKEECRQKPTCGERWRVNRQASQQRANARFSSSVRPFLKFASVAFLAIASPSVSSAALIPPASTDTPQSGGTLSLEATLEMAFSSSPKSTSTMPKKVPFAPLPAIEKLPLAVRKDIRDNYESKREDLESQATEIIGTKFTINFNPNQVMAYATDSSSTAGYILSGYAEGFISGLKSFVSEYEDTGKEYFNKAVTQSELSLEVDSLGDEAETISLNIKDGVLRILFHHKKLGYNQSWLGKEYFVKAIDAATTERFTLKAKSSIEKEWDANVDDVTKEIGEVLNMPDVVLDPNFEEVYAALKKGKKDDDSWESSFGTAVLAYFRDGLLYQLKYTGFKDDDMLQEGFAEGITSKTIKLRIVDALKTGYRNEAAIEDDILYLQTKSDFWYYNVSEMGDNTLKLLLVDVGAYDHTSSEDASWEASNGDWQWALLIEVHDRLPASSVNTATDKHKL